MLTFSFKSNLPLIGCGIDAESISRFEQYVKEAEPLPMVFSRDETAYIQALDRPADGFCASFCCKEAVFKALSQPIDYLCCRLFYIPGEELQNPVLTLTDPAYPEIAACSARICFSAADEMIAIVHLFGRVAHG